MEYILNIETATKNCSVSLANGGKTIFCKQIAEEGYSHAERLHVFIEEIIKEAGISLNDLSAVAVSQGPGSYTGLRIGVSAAKGLCFALGIPLIAVDTLEKAKNLPCIFNNWAVFYHREYETNHLLNETILKKKFQLSFHAIKKARWLPTRPLKWYFMLKLILLNISFLRLK